MTALAVGAVRKVGPLSQSNGLRSKSGFRTFGIVNPGATCADAAFLFRQQPRRSGVLPAKKDHKPLRLNLKTLRQKALVATVSVALAAIPALAAYADENPQTARGVITIPTPRSANLLQLRGIGGRGTALLQNGGTCHRMSVRLVAGDFEGRQINLRGQEPIVLELRDAVLVQALSRGNDIVSDEATISADPADTAASILLVSGLAEGTGFVINPGRNLVSDIFGARRSTISCDVFNQTPAANRED